MARASNTYVVIGDDGQPVGGFTVKHEMVTWLKRYIDAYPPLAICDVWRLPDGRCKNVGNRTWLGKVSDFLEGT